jgi:hypothetical protein
MERWRITWRNGFAPALSTPNLVCLRDALRHDDPRLQQGSTTRPAAHCVAADYPCEGACALGFCGWQAGCLSVGEVEEFFARACWEADERLGEPAACRWFLNWFDDTPRQQMRGDLLAEVELALALRHPPAEPKRPARNASRSVHVPV